MVSLTINPQELNNTQKTIPDLIESIQTWFVWIADLSPLGISLMAICGVFVWAVFFKESFDRARLAALNIFIFLKWFRREKVKSKFELEISSRRDLLNKEIGQDILPYQLKIDWVKQTDRESFIKDNKAVVRLDYHDNENKTFVLAALGFVRESLLPTAKQYIPESIMESTNLLITRRLIEGFDTHALNFLHSEILIPLFNKEPEIKQKYDELVMLDNYSMFSQVFLPELIRMGNELYPSPINTDVLQEEISGFIDFLHTIATKDFEEDAPLKLHTKLFHVQIVIVARMDKLLLQGRSPYIKAVNIGIQTGFKNIYLMARGKNSSVVERIAKHFEKDARVENVHLRSGNVRKVDNPKKIRSLCAFIKVRNTSIPIKRNEKEFPA
jgi:DNA-binding protein